MASRIALKRGSCNQPWSWAGRKGVSAQFASALLLALLGGLASVRAADKLEPNNTFETAKPLELGKAVEFSIHPPVDVDVFRFEVPGPEPAQVDILWEGVPPAIYPSLRLYDAKRTELADESRSQGFPLFYRRYAVPPGSYFLELRDGGGAYVYGDELQKRKEVAMSFRVDCAPVPMPGEPNNETTNATALALGKTIEGTLYPPGDRDLYRVEIPAGGPGVLTARLLKVPEKLRPELRLISEQDYYLANRSETFAGRPVTLQRELEEGGVYVVSVSAESYGGAALSREPYTLQVEYKTRAEIEKEGHSAPAFARPLPLARPLEDTFFPAGDRDFYRVEVPEPGRGVLDVVVQNVPDSICARIVFYDAEGKEIENAARGPGAELHYRRELDRAGVYTFHLEDGSFQLGREWLGALDDFSPRPYTVRADFTPVKDAFEPNPDHDTARVIAPGATVEATLFPKGDRDYYKVTVPAGQRGVLRVRLTGLPDHVFPFLQLDDAARKQVQACRAGRGQPAGLTLPTAGGDFFIAVRDADANTGRGWKGWDTSSSLQPYTLEVAFDPAADAGEPNDTAEAAAVLAVGKPVQACLFPGGDADFYRFELSAAQAGPLRIEASGFHDNMHAVLDLTGPDGTALGHVQRKQARLLLNLPAAPAGAYVLRVGTVNFHRGRWIGSPEQVDLAPYRLLVAPATARAGADAAEREPNDRIDLATAMVEAKPVWGRMDKAEDRDWYRLDVRAAGVVDVQLRDVPEGLDLQAVVYFRPGASAAAPSVLHLRGPRGDFNLQAHFPDIAFTRIDHKTAEAKTAFANPELLRSYRAIVVDNLHDPDQLDLRNPRVQQNLKAYVEGGGRFIMATPFCDLDFMNLKVEEAGRWHKNQAVNIGSRHALISGSNAGSVRNWGNNESLGYLTGWKAQGYERLVGHVSDPVNNAVTVAKKAGAGYFIVDTQILGHHANWPAADWKLRGYLGLPPLQSLGHFNDTTHNDRAPREGQPESFRVTVPGAGACFIGVSETRQRAAADKDYSVLAWFKALPADDGSARQPQTARRLELPEDDKPLTVELVLPQPGDRVWHRFSGRPNATLDLALTSVPPEVNPRLRLFKRPAGAGELPAQRILFLRGEHGQFDMDQFYPGLRFERIDWNDERAPAILLDPAGFADYHAVILQGLTRTNDFNFSTAEVRRNLAAYVQRGGRFLLLTPVCPIEAFGLSNDTSLSWLQDNVQEVYPAHPLLAGRARGDRVNGWPSAESFGYWVNPPNSGFETVLAEWRSPLRYAVTLHRAIGRGFIVLDAQPVGHRDCQAESLWKLRAYLGLAPDLDPVGTWDNTMLGGFGGEERVSVPLEEADYFLEVANLEGSYSLRPAVLTLRTESPSRPAEPDDTPAQARPVAPGQSLTANLYPGGDADWRLLQTYDRGRLGVKVLNPPDNIDPVVHVRRQVAVEKPLKVLYLEADPAAGLDPARYAGVSLTRIDAVDAGAAKALEGLAGFDMLILGSFSDARQFGLDSRAALDRIETFARQGGRVLVVAAHGFSHAENSAQMGAVLEAASSQWDAHGWHAQHACDGYKVPGNQGFGWCCGTRTPFPHSLTWSFGASPRTLDRVAIYNHAQQNDRRAREVEVQVSDDNTAYRKVAAFTLAASDERQLFRFPPTACRQVRLLITSNYGHANETQLGEVEFLGPDSVEGFLGAFHEGGWPSHSTQPLDERHWLLRRDSEDRLTGWPESRNDGWWTGWEAAGYEALCADSSDPENRAATLFRRVGKGWIALDAQRLNAPANADAAAWKLRNYFSSENLFAGDFDQTQGRREGGPETVYMDLGAEADLRLRVADNELTDNVANRAAGLYTFAVEFTPENSSYEPNDRPDQAGELPPGKPVRETLFPAGDEDWFGLVVEQPSAVTVRLDETPSSLDPIVEVYRRTEGLKPCRVLYLTCRPDANLDTRCHGPVPLAFTRIESGSAEEATAWDRLPGHDVAILESIDDPARFGMDRPETLARIETFAAGGGLFVLLAPRAYSMSLLSRQAGGRLVSCSGGQASDFENARRLTDGQWGYYGNDEWTSRYNVPLPNEFVWRLPGEAPVEVERLVVFNTAGNTNRCVKELEVLLADRPDEGAWRSVGRFTCEASPLRQVFSWAPARARYVKAILHANYGDARNTQLGELELYGPGQPEGFFGIPQVRSMNSGDALHIVDPQHWIVSRRVPSNPDRVYGWPRTGYFTGWEKSGFAPVIVAGSDTNRHATTLCKAVGRGFIVLDTQDLGLLDRADDAEPKLFNYYDLPATRVGRYNGTVEGRGAGEEFRYFSESGGYFLRIRDQSPWRASLDPYRLQATLAPVSRAFEPNNAPEQATRLASGQPVRVSLYPEEDIDWFAVDLAAGAPMAVAMTGVPETVMPYLEIYSATNLQRAVGYFGGTQGGEPGAPELFSFSPPAAGRYLLKLMSRRYYSRDVSPEEFTLQTVFTGPAPGIAPALLGGTPADGLRDASSRPVVRAFYNAPLQPGGVTPEALTVVGSKSGAVAGTVQYEPGQYAVSFTPGRELQAGEVVRVTARAGLPGLLGGATAGDATWRFTVRPPVVEQKEGTVQLALDPPAPVGAGQVRVTLVPTVKLRDPVRITAATADGTALEVTPPQRRPDGTWFAALTVPAGAKSQLATFTVAARDAQGKPVSRITQGRLFEIDTEPPPAVRDVAATAGRGGAARLSWKPPADAADVAAYELFRAQTPAPGAGLPDPVQFVSGAHSQTWDDPTPADGTWYYQVAARDKAGNRGPLSAVVRVATDRVPPRQAVTGVSARVVEKPRIDLAWQKADGADFTGYSIFRVRKGEALPRPQDGRPLTETTPDRTAVQDFPGDGEYLYAVAVHDSAGNIGTLSAPAPVVLDTRPAEASVTLPADPPLNPGTHRLVIALSEPLATELECAARMPDRSVRKLAPRRVDPLRYEVDFALAEGDPDGWVYLEMNGTDRYGNAGVRVARNNGFRVDSSPPRATVRLAGKARLGAGRNPVSVEFDEDVQDDPKLLYTVGGKTFEVALTRVEGRRFSGELALDAATPNGEAEFGVVAVDRFGHRGGKVVQGLTFGIDTVAPDAPLALGVRPGPERSLHLSWTASTREPIAFYRLYGAAAAPVKAAPSQRLLDDIRDVSAVYKPAKEEALWLAVCAVDRAGNESPLSEPVRGVPDTTPPPPPRRVTVALQDDGRVRVAWEAPAVDEPVTYRVYRDTKPVTALRGLKPVGETGETYLLDEPGKPALLHYAVAAVDEAGNARAAAALPFDFDIEPPMGLVTLEPAGGTREHWESEYVHYPIRVLSIGAKSVTLAATEPLRGAPTLRYRSPAMDTPREIPLTPAAGGTWTGTLTIPPRTDDGLLTFLFDGEDLKGNRGTGIVKGRGNLAVVDTLAPEAVQPLRLQSRPLGRIALAWDMPPGERWGELTYDLYRSTADFKTVDGMKPLAAGRRELTFEDAPERDGPYFYAVIAVDQGGNRGRLHAATRGVADATPPAAPTGLKAEVKGTVVLKWTPPAGEGLTYRVLRNDTVIAAAHPEPVYLDYPETDGRCTYRVVALDAAGNESVASAPAAVEFSDTLPAARITLEPPSPVKSTFRVTVTAGEPLREAPELFLHFVHGAPLRVATERKDERGAVWVGSVPVTADTPNGPAHFTFRGLNAKGQVGQRVREGAQLVIDTRAPSADVRLSPPSPVKPGKVAVTLRPSEPLREAPKLLYTTMGADPRPVVLTADEKAGTYVGAIEIGPDEKDGVAFFSFTGTDLAGNVGARLGNAQFVVDLHAPKPPIGLAAASKPHGDVELSWTPPVYGAAEVADQVAGYNLYLADAAIAQVAALTPIAGPVTRIPYTVRPPADGPFFFAVTTVDASGLESVPGASIRCVSDRTPPLPPRLKTPGVRVDAIELAWEADKDAVAFSVYVQAPGARDPVRVAGGLTEPRFVYAPLYGGRYAFRVQAEDALGHASPLSPAVPVDFEQLAPLARIILPAPSLGAGAHALKLETTRPLTAAPAVSVIPAEGKPIAVPMSGAGTSWTGTLTIGGRVAGGPARVAYSGTAQVGGRAVTGRGIVEGERLELDFTPPVCEVQFVEPVAERDGKAVLAAGRHALRLAASEPLAGDPVLRFTPRDRETVKLELVRQSPTEWRTVLFIDARLGDGSGIFEIEMKDRQGNRGDSITRHRNVDIDTTPPARITQVRAVVLPGGRCRVDWIPPFTPDGKPETDANLFQVYRSESEIQDVAGVMPYRTIRRTLGFVDEPRTDREYFYAVVAVDSAGNTGPLSGNASAKIDKTAPPPPRDVRANIMSNGVVQVQWQAPQEEKPFYFNLYLEKFPILTTAGLTPRNTGVTWTEIYGTPNDDGRYYFAVTSVDDAMNESAPSENAMLDYRAIPVIASFYLEPDIWLTDREYRVRLVTTKDLAEAPAVEVNSESGRRYPLVFDGSGREWQATLAVDAEFPEGTYGFLFRGIDAAGITGDEIKRGPLFHVDRTAPLPPTGLTVEADRQGTPGAVVLKWFTPKREKEATEVPHFYNVYRSGQPIVSLSGLTPVQTVTVELENLDDYTYRDMPPANGTFYYAVTSLDLARNESGPSNVFKVEVHVDAPRATIDLFRVRDGKAVPCALDGQGRPLAGLGKLRVVLQPGVPLSKAPALAWHLKRGEARKTPIALRAAGTAWEGDFEIREPLEEVTSAFFTFSGQSRSGLTGTYIGRGTEFRVDTQGPVPDIIIPSTFKMRVHVKQNKLLTAPVQAGRIKVRLSCAEELGRPPALSYKLDAGAAVPIPMEGFGGEWFGYMDIPEDAGSRRGQFFFEGVDRAGNASTRIAALRYEHDVDDDTDPPRRIASYATTAGVFETDTVAPAAPGEVETEMRKLGVAVIKWKEPAGEPNSYNLYRSLTPIVSTAGLSPIQTGIFAPIMVDAPPVDGNYFYAVTAVDFAGNESALSETRSVFIDTIKPELKITAVPSEEGFMILLEDDAPQELSLTINFPGNRTMQVELGGSSGELKEYRVVTVDGRRGVVLPQLVEFFNGRVEVIVNSPDPDGNMVEEITEMEMREISASTGGEVPSADGMVQLIIPPGLQPVIPAGPSEGKRVGGYDNLFFIRYANIPDEKPAIDDRPRRRDEVDPLPPGLEVVGRPYVIEMNQAPEEPLQLRGSATQADLSQLKRLTAKLKMAVPEQYSDAVADPEYLKTRLKVVKWVPALSDDEPGRWQYVPDIEIEPSNKEIIVPANDITTYVIVSERTPPSIRDLKPGRGEVVGTFKPVIGCRIVDKGTGVAVGAENRIVLTLDGVKVPEGQLEISKGDPTEVTVTYRPAQPLAPGRHVVGIRAEDVVENVADVKWPFLVDNKPPVIVSVLPAPDERLPIRRPLIQAVVRDEGGLAVEKTRLLIDGAAMPVADVRYDEASGLLTIPVRKALDSGVRKIELSVSDRTGLEARREWTIPVDVAPPVVTRVVPASDTYAEAELHEVAVFLQDELGAARILDFRVDGRKILPALRDGGAGFRFDPADAALRYLARAADGGYHEASVLFADDLGNSGEWRWTYKARVPDGLRQPGAPKRAPMPETGKDRLSFEQARELSRQAAQLAAAGKPAEAAAAYRKSLEQWQDPAVERALKRLEAEAVKPPVTVSAPAVTSLPEPGGLAPAQRAARQAEARKQRAQAAYLEMKGQRADALAAYRASLAAWPDAAVAAKIRELGGPVGGETAPAAPPPSPERQMQARKFSAEGRYLEMKGQLPEAVAAYEKSLGFVSDADVAARLAALKSTSRVTATVAAPDTAARQRQARKLMAEAAYLELRGDREGALNAYREAQKLAPSPRAGEKIRALQAPAATPTAATPTVAKPPSAPVAPVSRRPSTPEEQQRFNQARRFRAEGSYREARGQLDQAIRAYEKALTFWPDPALQRNLETLKQKRAAR